MRIADLDKETRAVVCVAHIVSEYPTKANLKRLGKVLRAFDEKHEVERTKNLLAAIFGDGK